jgi:uncharacterized membrane-anchored protein YitT (DUF2179 family)
MVYHYEKGINIKLTKNRIIILVIIAVVVLSFSIYTFYVPKPIYSVLVDGQQLDFRADLRAADKISVYPSEEELYSELTNSLVENITIAFKPADEEENPYYILQILEIVPKLSFAYSRLGLWPNFNNDPIAIESYENLTSTTSNLIIALVHPVYSNETAIRIKDNVIYLKAKSHEDFDLVTVKLLMVALGIELES